MILLRDLLSSVWLLSGWFGLVLLSCVLLIIDLHRHNRHIAPFMQAVWLLTVVYSGPFGLLIYYYAGRKQIRTDSLWRKGFRSVAHCYSGCGAGEIIGVFIATGIFSLGYTWTAIITFLLAYVFGYGMTLGPLLQDGMPLKQALIDTVYSDTATIFVMEVTAISLDLWLGANARMTHPLFWNSLFLSLGAGLFAAYPVNLLLVHFGVKTGMGDPRNTTTVHQH